MAGFSGTTPLNMWKIREVWDDREFFKLAYQWYRDVSGFVKVMQDYQEPHDEESFFESLGHGRTFRGDENGDPKVLVFAEKYGPGKWLGHLICPNTAHPDLIEATIGFARMELLREPCMIVCGVLKKHRARIRMLERVGFRDSGESELQGVYRGRRQEIVYYVAGRS